MGRLSILLAGLLLVLSACAARPGSSQTPTPTWDAAAYEEVENRIAAIMAQIPQARANLSKEELERGDRWVRARGTSPELRREFGLTDDDLAYQPSPAYLEYWRLQGEFMKALFEERDLAPPPSPTSATATLIPPRLSSAGAISVAQKWLRNMTEEEADDNSVSEEWRALHDDWPIPWRTEFHFGGRLWELGGFEASIYVDDRTGQVAYAIWDPNLSGR